MAEYCDFFMPLQSVRIRDGKISRPATGGNILVCCSPPGHNDDHMLETPEKRVLLNG